MTSAQAVDPEKMAAFQRLQSMGMEERLALAETKAQEAEAAGNQPLAQLLRAEIAKQRAPQTESSPRVVVAPGNIPTLTFAKKQTAALPALPQGSGAVDLLRHITVMHGALLDLTAKHAELLRMHSQLHASNAEMRAALNVLHNNHVATHGLVTQLHADLYGQKEKQQ